MKLFKKSIPVVFLLFLSTGIGTTLNHKTINDLQEYTYKIFLYKNGDIRVENDGNDCGKYYGQQPDGSWKLIYTTNGC